MDQFEYTPWFQMDKDGPPVRPGVYEGRWGGTPNGSQAIYPGFYLWNGIRWVGRGDKPDSVRASGDQARYWRGIIPGKDYPFDQVAKPRPHYSGVLERTGAGDKLSVQRLTVKGNEMVLAFTRERRGREPEWYEVVLNKTAGEFTGRSKIRIGTFTSDKTAQVRVPSFVESGGRIALSLLLQGVTSDWHSFEGVLSSAR
jgi:hypothetical protein